MNFNQLLTLSFVTLLSACGGSSGGGSSTNNNGGGNGVTPLTVPADGKSLVALNSTGDACSDANTDSFNCQTMVGDILNKVVIPQIEQFESSITDTSTAVGVYCSALGADDENDKQELAQAAWKDSMVNWQQLEPIQIGRLAEQREQFYSWFESNLCSVDIDVLESQKAGYDIATRTPVRRGLDALEYLLFEDQYAIQCPKVGPQAITNIEGLLEWDDLPLADRKAQRCSYAQKVSSHLVKQSQTLESTMKTVPFADEVTSLHEAVNTLSDSMVVYMDKNTKDRKIGLVVPSSATDAITLAERESLFANVSLSNIQQNLAGLRSVMEVENGQGLKDYLVAIDQGDLAVDMISAIDAALLDLDSTGTLVDVLEGEAAAACFNATDDGSDFGRICTLKAKIAVLTTDLKGKFLMDLGLTPPKEAEGDND